MEVRNNSRYERKSVKYCGEHIGIWVAKGKKSDGKMKLAKFDVNLNNEPCQTTNMEKRRSKKVLLCMKMLNGKRLPSTNCRFQYNGNVDLGGEETSAPTKTRVLGLKRI